MQMGHDFGYPMTWQRVVMRNHLEGDYDERPKDGVIGVGLLGLIRGDLRRLEKDQRDDAHLKRYAEMAAISPIQVKIVLDAFFQGSF
jgi:hypothetical protein